ncbi:MAG: LLM class flavin-dependent oxidoreductase [Candidatus Azotimanducaceae bacterium WSBS_2022_MAG_OTU7]
MPYLADEFGWVSASAEAKEEYQYLNMPFSNRGKRCDEQMVLLKKLWTEEDIHFQGDFHTISGARLNPFHQKPIPMWIGARAIPSQPVVRRIAQLSDGWFVLCSPEEIGQVRDAVFKEAEKEAVGQMNSPGGRCRGSWPPRGRMAKPCIQLAYHGAYPLRLRTPGGELSVPQHLTTLTRVMNEIPVDTR